MTRIADMLILLVLAGCTGNALGPRAFVTDKYESRQVYWDGAVSAQSQAPVHPTPGACEAHFDEILGYWLRVSRQVGSAGNVLNLLGFGAIA
jgi:hypothetical protein